jgi:predicted DCC family thiol-disulfide oxidoreductase YuxK
MQPILIYDGDCRFCRFWVARWRARIGDRIEVASARQAAARFPEIPPESFAGAVQFVDADGSIASGAGAIARALALAPGGGGWLRAYRRIPGAAPISEGLYRLVAANRGYFSFLTWLGWGERAAPSTYRIASCLFVRGIAVVYLIAFLSLWWQIGGLAGENGIAPAARFLDAVGPRLEAERFTALPTIFWFGAGDAVLRGFCAAGAAIALLAAAGLLAGPGLALLWGIYLSYLNVCRPFLHFQWDILLLEAGFLAILVAPWRLRCRLPCPRAAPRPALWLVRWLLFRLMLSSGVVKLASGDSTWWDLSALEVHYETQPLPTWTAWYAHQLPSWVHAFSCAVMFLIELAVPFLFFAPRRLRLTACALTIGLMALIAATGNYTFFNLLTVALCLILIDDDAWPWRRRRAAVVASAPPRRWPLWIGVPAIATIVVLSTAEMTRRWRVPYEWPRPVSAALEVLAPFHLINVYGLFADMTDSRPEIIIEGSDDGEAWLPYEFKWKPGDPARRPGFVAPHQPRLDWQMWFAALGDEQRNPWFSNLVYRLLQGKREVLALLETNPFPDAPPRYVRAVLYDYRFSDFEGRRADGSWWRRRPLRLYSPPRSLPPR